MTPENRKTHLEQALARIGRDPETRNLIVKALKHWEQENRVLGESIRDTTSGVVADALHSDVETISRRIQRSTGSAQDLLLTMLYRTKIGREFSMADEPMDHAWEPQTTELLCRMAKGAEVVLIGGAYCGDHAIPMMAEMAEQGGRCICFEPNSDQANMLCKNAAANNLENFSISNTGLWSETCTLVMVGFDSHGRPEIFSGQEGQKFEAITIDDYCAEHAISKLDVIMLDIEGGEWAALEGAKQFLAAPPDQAPEIIFEIHRSYVDWSNGLENTKICKLLLANGFEIFAIRDYQENVAMAGSPIEIIPITKCYLEGPPHGFNLIASKRDNFIDHYALKICENVSPKLLRHRDPKFHQPLTS